MDVATRANAIETRVGTSPWPDHEHSRGYAVLELPFSSGGLLGLRVWPQSDFTPWVSVWHRTPGGDWSIFNDGPSLETSCPRYWGPALERAELADVDVTWTGPSDLRVEMAEPELVWTTTVREPPLLRIMNAVSASLPLWTWKPAPLRRVRGEIASRLLGMGDVRLSFTSASGHEVVVAPEQILFVDESDAVLEGRHLGDPIRLETNPTIGGVPTPARPIFTFVEAHAGILDVEEYRRAHERARDGVPAGEEEA